MAETLLAEPIQDLPHAVERTLSKLPAIVTLLALPQLTWCVCYRLWARATDLQTAFWIAGAVLATGLAFGSTRKSLPSRHLGAHTAALETRQIPLARLA
jgi:hypothetical protein